MGIKKRTPPDLDAIDKRMARDDGGPVSGMTIRDWFAGKVLGAVYTASIARGDELQETIVDEAYEIADRMVAVRKQ